MYVWRLDLGVGERRETFLFFENTDGFEGVSYPQRQRPGRREQQRNAQGQAIRDCTVLHSVSVKPYSVLSTLKKQDKRIQTKERVI